MANSGPVFAFLAVVFSMIWAHKTADEQVFQPGNGQQFKFGAARPTRYLLYDVNPGEGFNLRRDVYMRVANLVKLLNEDEPWTIVLPPWGKLYHWRSPHHQTQIRWSTFFDVPSLGRHVPVIEFEDYLKVRGETLIDEVYYLQRYKEGWTNGKWEEKMDIRNCLERTGFEQKGFIDWSDPGHYGGGKFKEIIGHGINPEQHSCVDRLDEEGKWHSWFWDYDDVIAKQFKCLSVQAEAASMKPFLMQNTTGQCVFLPRAEQLIHGQYSEWSPEWWTARRSMVFAKHLRELGDVFRRDELESTDEVDNTIWDDDWTQMERRHGEASGGPYVAVHLRRRDFLYGHDEDVPSITGAVKQLRQALNDNNMTTLFVATDAPKSEYNELKHLLAEYNVVKYEPTSDVKKLYKDGGVAIIDQWIAAHARFFIGTSVSTFSFRIHEEREILGFDPKMTFNRLCGDRQNNCEQPSKWMIKYH